MNQKEKVFQEQIPKLLRQIFSHYWLQSVENYGVYHENYLKGLFRSEIRLNYMDKENSQDASLYRNKLSTIADINMFSTSLIYIQLLQVQNLGFFKNDENFELLLSQSLATLETFREKIYGAQVPVYTFWQQIEFQGKKGVFSQNIINAKLKSFSFQKKDLQYLENFRKILVGQLPLIPLRADNDCSSVVIAILGLLKENQSPFFDKWYSKNKNISLYYDVSLKFAYRPFNPNPSYPQGSQLFLNNYIIFKQFIELKYEEEGQLILPTSYIDTDQFIFNTIDAVVCSNFLYGLSYMIIHQLYDPKQEILKMMKDTVDLIAFVCQEVLTQKNRPNILEIFLHYPTQSIFYSYSARIFSLLNKHTGLIEILKYIKIKLQVILKETVTSLILQKSIEYNEQQIFWVQFLGNNPIKNRNQDAISTTALMVNCLLDTWTISTKSLTFFAEVPVKVKQVIRKGMNFLKHYQTQKYDQDRMSREIAAFCFPNIAKKQIVYGYEKQVKEKQKKDSDKQLQVYYWTGEGMTLSSILLAFCKWTCVNE